jgi:hypothetical protein
MNLSAEQVIRKSTGIAGNSGGPVHGIELSCTQLRWIFRCLAVGLASAQIVVGRNTFGPDPRSYMELARAILRHDWAMVPNSYWSALYPWLLAGMLGVFKPSLRWEFPVAHAFSIVMYLGCMAAFEFFWSSLLQSRQATLPQSGRSSTIPRTLIWMLGYSFFIWATVGDLVLLVNPDLLVAAAALCAAGLLLRIQNAQDKSKERRLYIWLGVCLGVGYLVKAILFPMAPVFLAASFATPKPALRERGRGVALAFLIFAVIAAPEVALLSHAKGHLTFSETGKLNFAWFNYNLPYRNWQGEPAGTGKPAHPTRKLFDHPAVYEYNGPLRSSYPPWYDPSYWNEGLSPAFNATLVARHFFYQLFELGGLVLHPTAWIAGIFLIFLGADLKRTFSNIAFYPHLILIALAAFSMFCLTSLQGRFLPPWEILVWGSLLTAVQLRPTTAPIYRVITPLVCFVMLSAVGYLVYGESIHGFHNDASAEYAIAEGLQKMGLRPGENIAAVGFDMDAHWAYLTRTNIVAEIGTDDTCLFWSEAADIQQQVMEKFAQAGAEILVVNAGGGIRTTSRPPPHDLAGCARPGAGWRKIPGVADYAFFLK